MSVVRTFEKDGEVVCYIDDSCFHFIVYEGKPSDVYCEGEPYDNLEDAIKSAEEYVNEV